MVRGVHGMDNSGVAKRQGDHGMVGAQNPHTRTMETKDRCCVWVYLMGPRPPRNNQGSLPQGQASNWGFGGV